SRWQRRRSHPRPAVCGASMENILVPFLMQLAGQSPVLLVYLVGMILALVFWRRCPGPCAFTLVATGLLMLTSIAQTFVSLYLIHARADMGWANERLSWMLSANALIGSVV